MAVNEKEPVQSPQSAVSENAIDTGDIQLPRREEDDLVNKIMNDFSNADSQRTEWLKKKAQGLKLYWGVRDGNKSFPFKNCSDVRVPLIRTLKETLQSNVWSSFDLDEPFDTLPVGLEDVEKARKVKKFLNWQFTNEIDFSEVLDGILDHCLAYGHAVLKTSYLKEVRIRKSRINGQMLTGPEILFDGVKVHIINPEDFLFPPYACQSDVQDLDYVIHEVPMTTSDIRRRMASGQYRQVDLDVPKSDSGRFDVNSASLQDVKNKHIGIYQTERSSGQGGGNKHHKVIEWYGFYDIDGDGIEEDIMVTLLHDSREILRLVIWDISRPFTVIRFSPLVNTPWGESIADLIGQINEELNTLHNQRVDAVTLNNIPYGFYDPLSGFDPEQVQLVPGMMIPTNGPPQNAVHFPVHQIVRPEMYREEELLSAYAERLVGAGANVQGTENPRQISATEVATIDRRAGIRFKLIFSRIQRGLEKLAKNVIELNQRLMPVEKQVRVMGPNDADPLFGGMTHMMFKRDELQGKFDVRTRGEPIVERDLSRQNQMLTYQIGTSNPLIANDPESLFYLTRDTLEALGAKNRELYLKKPQFAVPQNPEDEQARIAQGENIDPVLGENVDYHLKKHAEFINSPNFQLMTPESRLKMVGHFQKTVKLQQLVKQMVELQNTVGQNGQPI